MNTAKHEHRAVDPSCREVFERLSEYLDGELSPQDCAHIQEHIKDCAPCVAFVESLKASIQASHDLRPAKPVHKLDAEAQKKLQAAWKAALERRSA